MDSLPYRHSGGRPETLTPSQKKRLVELSAAGPLGVGWEPAGWHSVVIRVLIGRAFGVLDKRHDVCTLLHNLGFSFQKARLVSEQLAAAKRLAGLPDKWPALVRAAKRCKGLSLFDDAASVAPWGSPCMDLHQAHWHGSLGCTARPWFLAVRDFTGETLH
jgi:hypothetical protein